MKDNKYHLKVLSNF